MLDLHITYKGGMLMEIRRIVAIVMYLLIMGSIVYFATLNLRENVEIKRQYTRVLETKELLLNIAFFIVAISIVTLLFSLLVKKEKTHMISAILLAILMYLSFYSLYSLCEMMRCTRYFVPLVLINTILWLMVIILRGHELVQYVHEVLLVGTGTLTGIIMATVIPERLLIALLLFLSIYDIISVRVGLIKLLMDKTLSKIHEEHLEGPIIKTLDLRDPISLATAYVGLANIGIGDIICYAIMMSMYGISFGEGFSILALMTIVVGSLALYYLMRKYEMKYAPGLPIPIIISLALYFLLKFYYS